MFRRIRRGLAALLLVGAFVVGIVSASSPPTTYSPAAAFALRIDAALDRLPEPAQPTYDDLTVYWPFEIAPYFEYEGLTDYEYGVPPIVILEPQLGAMEHVHIAGYTYCEDAVFLNARYINPVSVWNERTEVLATLVHEMVHTVGGDFCSFDSVTAESRTQLGTLEVLAAMANHGNEYAFYALLDELRDIAMSTAELEYIEAGDIAGFRALYQEVYPEAARLARIDKSLRFWANDMETLKGILDRYSKVVFDDFQDGEFLAYLPGYRQGATTIPMDDLVYVLSNLDELSRYFDRQDDE